STRRQQKSPACKRGQWRWDLLRASLSPLLHPLPGVLSVLRCICFFVLFRDLFLLFYDKSPPRCGHPAANLGAKLLHFVFAAVLERYAELFGHRAVFIGK